jgi:hypothetical protein
MPFPSTNVDGAVLPIRWQHLFPFSACVVMIHFRYHVGLFSFKIIKIKRSRSIICRQSAAYVTVRHLTCSFCESLLIGCDNRLPKLITFSLITIQHGFQLKNLSFFLPVLLIMKNAVRTLYHCMLAPIECVFYAIILPLTIL